MDTDPAASYRQFTPRQRAQAAARFDREAASTRARVEAERTAANLVANIARTAELLAAAEFALHQGTLKGAPLTPAQRRDIETIAARARKVLRRYEED